MYEPYNLTTLTSAKDYLNKTDGATDKDALIHGMIGAATASIIGGGGVNREIRSKTYTEVYDGNGTRDLKLNNIPATSITSITIDSDRDGLFSDESAESSDDYRVDLEGGRIHADFTFPKGFQNVQIVYVAGFSVFQVVTGTNDVIDWNDGSDREATLTAGKYTGSSLASHIQTKMNAVVSSPAKTVVYNVQTGKFKIAQASGTFILKFFNGTNAAQTCGLLIGFDPSINQSERNAVNWGTWRHASGTVSTAETTLTFDERAGRIKIRNTSTGKNLLISFDGGDNFRTFFEDIDYEIAPINNTSIIIKGSASSTTYQIDYTIEGGILTWTSDVSVLGIPADIQLACNQLVKLKWNDSGEQKQDRLGLTSVSDAQAGTTTTINPNAEQQILDSIGSYRRWNV